MAKATKIVSPDSESSSEKKIQKMFYLSPDTVIALMRYCADELEFNHRTVSNSDVADLAIKTFCTSAAAKRKR